MFVYDPEVPVLAPGGPAAASGQFDQAALEMGNNVLVYTSEPLREPLWIFGTPRMALYAATSSRHTDFTAKLVRVRPDGVADFICIGIARSSYLFREAGYTADKVQMWEFDLEPTSCRFAAATAFGWKSPAAPFRCSIAIREAASLPATRLRGTGSARHKSCITRRRPSALYLPVSEAPL